MRQGYLIPVYNHGKTTGPLVEALLQQWDLPVILVDDGSDGETKAYLADIAGAFSSVVLVTLDKNQGKGAALYAGIDRARELGLTHLLQIDADGQHDPGQAAFFLEESAKHPEAAICGFPVFDGSAPLSRVKGRNIANVWTRITTLSGNIPDAMCGFRVYPVETLWRLSRRYHMDPRMGADIEILVRLVWWGVPLFFHPVRVVYPPDGISHFHLVRDNIRISLVFFRLFWGMLLRLPMLIYRRFRAPGGSP
ncbi:glycosyltransferase family 2 protein [Treponema sp. TIM-1]|uniref:glycosyltransferase family 2 protein n=1 Tax=Treponema sp. TIM-1 TaxID=2898417 RepID=UPI0039813390